jgi:hypothetical protein
MLLLWKIFIQHRITMFVDHRMMFWLPFKSIIQEFHQCPLICTFSSKCSMAMPELKGLGLTIYVCISVWRTSLTSCIPNTFLAFKMCWDPESRSPSLLLKSYFQETHLCLWMTPTHSCSLLAHRNESFIFRRAWVTGTKFHMRKNNGFYGCWYYLKLPVFLWVNYCVSMHVAFGLTLFYCRPSRLTNYFP